MYDMNMRINYSKMEACDESETCTRKVKEEILPYDENELMAQINRLIDIYDEDTIELSNWAHKQGYTDITIQISKEPVNSGSVGFIHILRICPKNETEETMKAFSEEGYRLKKLIGKRFRDMELKSHFRWKSFC